MSNQFHIHHLLRREYHPFSAFPGTHQGQLCHCFFLSFNFRVMRPTFVKSIRLRLALKWFPVTSLSTISAVFIPIDLPLNQKGLRISRNTRIEHNTHRISRPHAGKTSVHKPQLQIGASSDFKLKKKKLDKETHRHRGWAEWKRCTQRRRQSGTQNAEAWFACQRGLHVVAVYFWHSQGWTPRSQPLTEAVINSVAG